MNLLFLSLLKFDSFDDRNIYSDLLRELIKHGHNVYAVCPSERRNNEKTNIKIIGNNAILTVKTLNIQKTNIIEKGLGTFLITNQYKRAINKYFENIKFDTILYSTPPITLYGVVKYFKAKNKAKTFLMLKDIFPQNALDLGLLSRRGVKGILYKIFRNKEKNLYSISDRIGCMSEANLKYVIKNNPEIDVNKLLVYPNSIEVKPISKTNDDKISIRNKYDIPQDKTVFIYGGNLGKPQGVPFIIECLKKLKNNDDVYFVIVGDGTDFSLLEKYLSISNQTNCKLMKRLSSDDFDKLVSSSDVGLIFLDHRFTIPNFPSRLLSYMQAGIPVLACTDPNTDVGKVIVEGGFGWWCESNDANNFALTVKEINNSDFSNKKDNSFTYLNEHYNVSKKYEEILS